MIPFYLARTGVNGVGYSKEKQLTMAESAGWTLEGHTLGPTCVYHEDEPDTLLTDSSAPPPVKSQFFYVSSLPIDDPLSPLPPIQADKASKQPPQPFSARDNAALEEAWQGFHRAQETSKRGKVRPSLKGILSFPKFKEGVKTAAVMSPAGERIADSVARDPQNAFAAQITDEYSKLPSRPAANSDGSQSKSTTEQQPPKSVSLPKDAADQKSTPGRSSAHSKDHRRDHSDNSATSNATGSQVMLSQSPPDKSAQNPPVDAAELHLEEPKFDRSPPPKRKGYRQLSPFRRKSKGQNDYEPPSQIDGAFEEPCVHSAFQAASSDISGRPFARAPSKRNVAQATMDGTHDVSDLNDTPKDHRSSRSQSQERGRSSKDNKPITDKAKVYVPVGIARLHLVELPELTMKPIYWSPINDASDVLRATWFYKDTMLPVPVDVANCLEIGYEYIRPYSESYQDELQACIDNGASAEMKIVHKLWPDDKSGSRPSNGDVKLEDGSVTDDDPAVPDASENTASDPNRKPSKRLFQTHSVIYTDRKNAQILKPSLLPSVSQNRRPLSSIRKGRQIGVAVVRGFDRKAWSRLYPSDKMTQRKAHAQIGAYMSQSGDATTRGRRQSCATCNEDARTPHVSDLVLVIHGIGQKLSERVDSYHFTHAIDGLRREFNVELSSEAVKGNLKSDTGVMVLPINWRLTVKFDEESKSTDANEDNTKYKLADITPDTLPAVRSIISDVMLDIPYYLSHHKDKMTAAVIREANRVYRLWCRNNPGFQQHGRIHIVAHSLGSVMAMEILSNQPTRVPTDVKLDESSPSEKMFEFDTTNLFCCGSPAGFFLLLNNARLIPRKGRDKPGMEGEDHAAGVAAEEGYGCLAIDNLYNICHRNDPIAYLLNASVDSDYAASLQPAHIPSATTSLFSRLWSSTASTDAYSAKGPPQRPSIQHMPSTVELETHNFTREEIAEKRMYLLNENGQIDYYLASSGGPLEIQYLSMLSAHSSYWLSRDFVRFLVVEIGRERGKSKTVEVLRAKKKREVRRGVMH